MWVSSQRVRPIDVMHLGKPHVICCWEVDGWLVDPGPQSCEETLLAAIGGERPKGLLLTHIHFDHAVVPQVHDVDQPGHRGPTLAGDHSQPLGACERRKRTIT